VAAIEEGWVANHKIIPQRKNMDTSKGCGNGIAGEAGVDLNRNFAIDFGQVDPMADF
jgi:hypothetical protein